jgi:hypothetical protein
MNESAVPAASATAVIARDAVQQEACIYPQPGATPVALDPSINIEDKRKVTTGEKPRTSSSISRGIRTPSQIKTPVPAQNQVTSRTGDGSSQTFPPSESELASPSRVQWRKETRIAATNVIVYV